ncbi:hypothetical protein, partial [Photorhabdus laumondii]
MGKKYTVTYKVAPQGSQYVYQADKNEHKAGDVHSSFGGHMWYVLNDGDGNKESFGFESKHDQMLGEGQITPFDDVAYQQTSYETTVELTEFQYNRLKAFSEDPSLVGFDETRYNVAKNSCVDFVFASLKAIGYNEKGSKGELFPNHNPMHLRDMLQNNGSRIIRDNLSRYIRYSDFYYLD